MSISKLLLTGIAGMGLLAVAADTPSAADKKFMMEAASGGMTEVELGKLAVSKGSDQKVKDFGQKMIDDHTKANDELKALASQKSVTLPTEPMPKDKAVISKMSGMSGAAFDKAYVADMVKDHKKDVADFQKEANSGMDADVKGWASKTLPTLQSHEKMIEDIQSGMKGGKMSSNMKMD